MTADQSAKTGQAAPDSLDMPAEWKARRAAMRAYDLACARRLERWLAAGGTVIATVCVAWFVVIGAPDAPTSPDATASAQPLSPTVMTSAEPAPARAQLDTPTVSVATASEPPPVELTSAPLQRTEIREVQRRLRWLGFNPGPIDGVAGPITESAVLRYRQNRGQQDGAVDRFLLEQLRQYHAPEVQVAQRAARPAARSSDPFEPLRVAGYRFTRWVQSLTR